MRRTAHVSSLLVSLFVSFACEQRPDVMPAQQPHSSALAMNAAGSRLFVVHPDADSVSVLDVASRRVVHETRLASHAPARDGAGRYEPAVSPRALALDSAASTLYVTGQRSGKLYALDADSAEVKAERFVCSEPIGVLVSRDDASVFVACAQDDQVVEVSAHDLAPITRVECARKPWALAWAADGVTLLATHLLGPGVSRFATGPLVLDTTWPLADGVFESDAGIPDVAAESIQPHGAVRGIYDALIRPGSSELWVAHLMLGTDTPQPILDFQRTVFPALSLLDAAGSPLARLSIQADPSHEGAFGDVVSGPHALAFSDDGALAFVVDANSEDVLVLDAEQRVELQLVRPLPGHMPEAIVWSHDKLYVQERNSEDVAVFRVERHANDLSVLPDGPAIKSLHADPMPETLRLGQKLFYSANSDDLAVTQNHWVACASCHLEGRSDAVTWKFTQGPRDTPTNAGGLLDTGFLFRTADRAQLQDYWQTIDIEQGGHFDGSAAQQTPLLDALADYVNYAIPTPVPPSIDSTHTLRDDELVALRATGQAVFERLHCQSCHLGSALTDSGANNQTLDLSGPAVSADAPGGVLLHDVGTCVTDGAAPDVAHEDIQGHVREACAFDTPQLRGLWDSAPYLHDGSAATLADVLPSMLAASVQDGEPVAVLSEADQRALIEYLRGL